MSLFTLLTAGLAAFAPLVAAYTKPTGDAPQGNPISQPGLNSVVPVGEGFTITWEPTTKGTVTLVLLKGPSSNAVPQYAIVEKTENDGSFVWTPSKDLAPSDPSTPAQGYGIQLIDDATGQYQYTTQFGISNPDYKAGPKSSSSSSTSSEKATKTPASVGKPSGTAAPYPTVQPVYTTKVVTELTTYCPEATHLTYGNATYTVHSATTLTITDCPCTITQSASKPVGTAYSTGAFSPSKNVTMVAPSGNLPSTIKTSAAPATTAPSATYQSPPAQQTGAASNVAMSFFGLVAAAGVAVAAF